MSIFDRVGYHKIWETRVVRTKHRVVFADWTQAKELKEFLKNVPDDAKFEELDWGEDGDNHYIEFIHEHDSVPDKQRRNDADS